MKKSFNQNGISQVFIIIIIALISAGLAGAGVWYWQQQEMKKVENSLKTGVTKPKTIPTSSPTTSPEIPSNFKSVTLNEINIYYPESWGTPKTEVTQENLSADLGPAITFEGEQAIFGEWESVFYVNNVSSYEKEPWGNSQKIVNNLKQIYEQKRVDGEDLFKDGYYIPPINAAVETYNFHYIENYDSSWRGYWYLGTIGQAINVEIHFVSIMFSKDTNKVLTIDHKIASKQAEQLQKEIPVAFEKDNGASIQSRIRAYLKTIYKEDSEVKNIVDNEALKVCNFVK